MRKLLSCIAALVLLSGSASATPPPPGYELEATGGQFRFLISTGGRVVTVQNVNTHQMVQVDVIERCGAKRIGNPTDKKETVFLDGGIRIAYTKGCVIQVMLENSQVSCSGCD